MAAARCLLTRKQLQCSMCQGLLHNPVTLPCGHNVCSACVTEHWDNDINCRCPTCGQVHRPRPELQVNGLISEVVHQFRSSAHDGGRSSFQCGYCDEMKEKLMIFAWVFVAVVCVQQAIFNYQNQNLLKEEEGGEGKKVELVKTEAELQQMIQRNQQNLRGIKRSVELGYEAAYRERTEAAEVFTALTRCVETGQAELTKAIEQRQRAAEVQAEGFVRLLQDEISELQRRRMEVELLSVARLEEALSNEMKKEMKKLLEVAELKQAQQYALPDLTLDPDTAHPRLVLSHDLKQVNHGDAIADVSYGPRRFTRCPCVLGKQSFSKGRFYYEVKVKGKMSWEVGVVRESVDRKRHPLATHPDGYWVIQLYEETVSRSSGSVPVELPLSSKPETVGVLVDYEGRLVSFYDANTAALIHSFTGCSFTDELHPYFNSGDSDSAPLIISPVAT